MRHLFLVLLIALLPVRGWVGNAMALDMAAQQAVAVSAPSAMPDDCPMHAEMAARDGDSSQQESAGAHCSDCDTCQLCLALASLSWADLPMDAWSRHAGPLDSGLRFSSADSVSGLKPPIS